jgi:hypothetical protein
VTFWGDFLSAQQAVLPKTVSLVFSEISRSSQQIGLCEKRDQQQHVVVSFLLIRKKKSKFNAVQF